MSPRRFDRAVRRPVPVDPASAWTFVRARAASPSFLALSATHRAVLLHAALFYADGEGKFWPRIERWATEVGVSRSTVSRAIEEAEKQGLLTRSPYMRPDGTQGTTTYRFARCVTGDLPCEGDAARCVTGEPRQEAARWVTGDTLERLSLERESRPAGPYAHAREPGPPELREALEPIGGLGELSAQGQALLRAAWIESPEGVRRCVKQALTEGKSPPAFLVFLVQDGEHRKLGGSRKLVSLDAFKSSTEGWISTTGWQFESEESFRAELEEKARKREGLAVGEEHSVPFAVTEGLVQLWRERRAALRDEALTAAIASAEELIQDRESASLPLDVVKAEGLRLADGIETALADLRRAS